MEKAKRQLRQTPYDERAPDFSGLGGVEHPTSVDYVSVADLLRNAFVYPPHSIYRDVKLATFGFDDAEDLHASKPAQFRLAYLNASEAGPKRPRAEREFVDEYADRLCVSVAHSTSEMRAPCMLQSGGKDSTSLAIAIADTRPDTVCLTYLGGREEDEVASARMVAKRLGLRHEALVCEPGRAYERYLALVPRMPLLTADFATLSYADLVTEIAASGRDGVVDGLGSDLYFGTPLTRKQRMLRMLARGVPLPRKFVESRVIGKSFLASYVLGTVQMDAFERFFPGSRFTDAEVDELLRRPLARKSRARLATFQPEMRRAESQEARRRLAVAIAEAGAAFAKGMYTSAAAGLRIAYPFCDRRLRDWVFQDLPPEERMDARSSHSKIIVRAHIARRFSQLPYVSQKGSFRFDVCALAETQFDRVHAFARAAREHLPGAASWLERNRPRLSNKYFGSKFYLLAVILPWLIERTQVDAVPR